MFREPKTQAYCIGRLDSEENLSEDLGKNLVETLRNEKIARIGDSSNQEYRDKSPQARRFILTRWAGEANSDGERIKISLDQYSFLSGSPIKRVEVRFDYYDGVNPDDMQKLNGVFEDAGFGRFWG